MSEPIGSLRRARALIQEVHSEESRRGRSYGGHRHTGPNHPLTGKPAMSARRYPKK